MTVVTLGRVIVYVRKENANAFEEFPSWAFGSSPKSLTLSNIGAERAFAEACSRTIAYKAVKR